MVPRTDERPSVIALSASGRYEEGRAVDSDILPGMLLMVTATEDNPAQSPATVDKSTANGTKVPLRIALEDRLGNAAGEILGRNKDSYFATDDVVPFLTLIPGDIVQVRVAKDVHYTVGQYLESSGTGLFEVVSSGIPLLQIMEDLDGTTAAVQATEKDDTLLVRAQAI